MDEYKTNVTKMPINPQQQQEKRELKKTIYLFKYVFLPKCVTFQWKRTKIIKDILESLDKHEKIIINNIIIIINHLFIVDVNNNQQKRKKNYTH